METGKVNTFNYSPVGPVVLKGLEVVDLSFVVIDDE